MHAYWQSLRCIHKNHMPFHLTTNLTTNSHNHLFLWLPGHLHARESVVVSTLKKQAGLLNPTGNCVKVCRATLA